MKTMIRKLKIHKGANLSFRRLRRSAADQRGMAATEFALILPLMATIFFGMLEASDAMMANRRVVNSTNALADLVTQEKKISTTQVEDIFKGVRRMLEPTDTSGLTMRLLSVKLDPGADPNSPNDDKVIIEWSRADDGSIPYPVGAEYAKITDKSLLQSGVSLIIAEMTYVHHSGLTNKILGSPITYNRMASRWPRRSTRVRLCTPGDTVCW